MSCTMTVADGMNIGSAPLDIAYDSNTAALNAILDRYASHAMIVADVTCRYEALWKAVKGRYDLRSSADCRSLTYAASSIDVLVFDPAGSSSRTRHDPEPFNEQGEPISDVSLVEQVLDRYEPGIREAYRVLRLGGLLVLNYEDTLRGRLRFRSRIEVHVRALAMGFADTDEVIVHAEPRFHLPVLKHVGRARSSFLIYRKQLPRPFGHRTIAEQSHVRSRTEKSDTPMVNAQTSLIHSVDQPDWE